MLTAEQHAQRLTGIGGSDVGAILGLNKYRSALDVYLEKIGEVQPEDLSGNQAVHFGNVLEDVVAQEYERRTGAHVRRRNLAIVHKQHPFVRANLDRSVDGERKVLECKTANQYTAGSWGPDGSDEVPDSYLVQVVWYMLATGYRSADLAVLIGGQDFRIYQFAFDRELQEMVFEHCADFWVNNVQKRVAPEPTCERDLETLYSIDNGRSIVATPAIEAAHDRLVAARHQMKVLEADKKALEFDIKAYMGEHSDVVLGADGTKLFSWKKAKDIVVVDSAKLKADTALFERFSTVRTGSRRFLVK